MGLHSSVGRASHQCCGGHRFESRWSPDFFRLLLSNCLNWEIHCDDWSFFTFIYDYHRVHILLSSSNSMTFHDFVWPFQVFQENEFSFKNSKTFSCFSPFFDLKQFNRHKLCAPKCVTFTLFNYPSLSVHCLCLVICNAQMSVTKDLNLKKTHKTLIFHDFQGSTIKFHRFPGLENEILNSMTFQVFHDLYEPCTIAVHIHCMNYFIHTSPHLRKVESQSHSSNRCVQLDWICGCSREQMWLVWCISYTYTWPPTSQDCTCMLLNVLTEVL